ncbi:hypothetical protein D1007_04387 [Hordeum vulgare]|nr:hypothetical protein D1007_04387 [Hordeum vulgare]
MGAVAACQKACGTELMYDLCISMMRQGGADMSTSHMESATAYAILAVQSAGNSLGDTMSTASDQLSLNPSFSSKQRDAYEGRMNDYNPAQSSIETIEIETLPSCHYEFLASEYERVITNVENWLLCLHIMNILDYLRADKFLDKYILKRYNKTAKSQPHLVAGTTTQ